MSTPMWNLFNSSRKFESLNEGRKSTATQASFKKHGWQNTFSHHPKGKLVDIYTHPDHPGHAIHHEPHSGKYEHKVEHGFDRPLATHLATHAAWHEQTKKDAAKDAWNDTI